MKQNISYTNKKDKNLFAMKVIDADMLIKEIDSEIDKKLSKKINYLSKPNHYNIVKIICCIALILSIINVLLNLLI